MNIYSLKQRWKTGLFLFALVIVAFSLWYTSGLVQQITDQEKEKLSHWAGAVMERSRNVKEASVFFEDLSERERKNVELLKEVQKEIASLDLNANLNLASKIIEDNTYVPVILTDQDNRIIGVRNFPQDMERDTARLKAELEQMRLRQDRVEVPIDRGKKNYLYFKESIALSEMRRIFSDMQSAFRAEVLGNAATSTVIITDSSQTELLDAAGTIDSTVFSSSAALLATLADLAEENPPLRVELGEGNVSYIFFRESFVLTQLRYFPVVQIGIIGLFIFISYLLFSTARRSEQNQVWVGMSKETAHQLGTPLSSMMAWLELLKEDIDPKISVEIDKDLKRLTTVTERFSKVGSAPDLREENLVEVVINTINYMKTRTSDKVKFKVNSNNMIIRAKLNVPLFEWVIENLVRNAVDAMSGGGSITVDINKRGQEAVIDLTDSGKGIPSSKIKTVFQPGFTTKKRGWGLGLSLTKRIVHNYHQGKIFVKRSEMGVGTTFRIVLNPEPLWWKSLLPRKQ